MKRNLVSVVFMLFLIFGAVFVTGAWTNDAASPLGDPTVPAAAAIDISQHEYTEDIPVAIGLEVYQNNVRLRDPLTADYRYDVKKVYQTPDNTRVVDFPNGFYVDLPGDVSFDFSRGEAGVKGYGDGYEVLLTCEASPYEDTVSYLDEYINQYVGNPVFQKANHITLHEDALRTVGRYSVRILSMTRQPAKGSEVTLNSYTYAYMMHADYAPVYHRIMIKAERYDPNMVEQILQSFTAVPRQGTNQTVIATKPVLPHWNAETRAFYESFCNREDVLWGVYNYKLITADGMAPSMQELQEKLDYRFSLCMGYTYLMMEPPVKGLQEAYDDGKITEMTLQVCEDDHTALSTGENPCFEVIDGLWDDQIRKYARAFKDFAHPILLRVNNEMNTDWCTYSGVVTMQDPDIYKMIFDRIYHIFMEEGVDNAIWIFNPQFGNFPPASFNHYMNYYPGNDKIQVLGVTRYNTGTYFYRLFQEEWVDFRPAFDALQELYLQSFPSVPWMVTEFASSSYGGSKVQWMKDMFTYMGDYPNIKAAVWFNWRDMDFRQGREHIVARPYFLDETSATLEVFRQGVHGAYSRPPQSR